jgi:hypothetical protein
MIKLLTPPSNSASTYHIQQQLFSALIPLSRNNESKEKIPIQAGAQHHRSEFRFTGTRSVGNSLYNNIWQFVNKNFGTR